MRGRLHGFLADPEIGQRLGDTSDAGGMTKIPSSGQEVEPDFDVHGSFSDGCETILYIGRTRAKTRQERGSVVAGGESAGGASPVEVAEACRAVASHPPPPCDV